MRTQSSSSTLTRTSTLSKRLLLAISVALLCLSMAGFTSVWAKPTPPTGTTDPQQTTPIGGLYIKSHRVTIKIDNQVAVTQIEQVFVNGGGGLAEGTYLFPLPAGAAVSDLSLTINGQVFKPQILNAQQAQSIYTQIVRQQRDPVLLQYVGRDAIKVDVFPIPAGEERKIEITYSNVVTAENGLFSYLYPLKTDYISKLPVQNVSVSVTLQSNSPISTAYSPNPLVAISRPDENTIKAGFETTNYRAPDDFALYYGLANAEINANLLTYRAGANEDGYFMLMLNPPTKVNRSRIIPKDVFIVLDQSGSMQGEKWRQAQKAAKYVLNNLNDGDRFNALVFSTGYRLYAKAMQNKSEVSAATGWIDGLEALGGTDINSALTTALDLADPERQTIVLFITDGLPSEGVIDARAILANVEQRARPNTRVFAFGVGNDVDTFLLDSLSSKYGGVSVYVRPSEDIEQKVSNLYNKITSPVLTALKLDFGGILVDEMYPASPLPDLFAGQQLIVVGRFRQGGTGTITLTGDLNRTTQRYNYENLKFPDNAGGQPFIPRLWATRKIGALLNQIRLSGENRELVDAVVQLSIRYGIITPYTSFLIQENPPVVSNDGRVQPPPGTPMPIGIAPPSGGQGGAPVAPMIAPTAGAAAVDSAADSNSKAEANQAAAAPTLAATSGSPNEGTALRGSGSANEPIKQVSDRTFILRNGVWIDTLYADTMSLVSVEFLSDDYFKLLNDHPEINAYLAVSDHVIVVIGNVAYEIKPSA